MSANAPEFVIMERVSDEYPTDKTPPGMREVFAADSVAELERFLAAKNGSRRSPHAHD